MAKYQYYNNEYASTEYTRDQENYRENSIFYDIQRQQPSYTTDYHSTTNNYRSSPDIVKIPCEICNEQIDLSNWSAHTRDCRKRRVHSAPVHTNTTNREPIIEEIPCEYCQKLFSVERLRNHEIRCLYKPERISRVAELPNPRPIPIATVSPIQPSNIVREAVGLPRYLSTQLSPNSTSTYSLSSRNMNDQAHHIIPQDEPIPSHVPNNIRDKREVISLHDNNNSTFSTDRHQSPAHCRTSNILNSRSTYDLHGTPTGNASSASSQNRYSSDSDTLAHQCSSMISLNTAQTNRKTVTRRNAFNFNSYRLTLTTNKSANKRQIQDRNNTNKSCESLVDLNLGFCSPHSEEQIQQPVIISHVHGVSCKPKYSNFCNPIPWK